MSEIKFINWSHKIEGVWEVILPYWLSSRGVNFEGLNRNKYPEPFKPFFDKTPVDSFSISVEGSLRGMHTDPNYKLIQLLYGRMQFVIYDDRENSPTKGNALNFIVRSDEARQFLVPPYVYNGHLALFKEICFSYKLSEGYFPPEQQKVLNYRKVPVDWYISNPILSERDAK